MKVFDQLELAIVNEQDIHELRRLALIALSAYKQADEALLTVKRLVAESAQFTEVQQ